MNLLFPTAYAQEAGGAFNTSNLVLFGGMFLLMYLIIFRPQSKRAKAQKELESSIAKGDEVMTAGGMLGKVTKVNDDYVAILGADKGELKMQKSSIVAALPKGTIAQI
ncbi:MAG: preprotein translocase subunit YajC [Pseudomonadales bacterium]|nr:preprotein translocase subunit YajC [Pseudomonadales bacterium]